MVQLQVQVGNHKKSLVVDWEGILDPYLDSRLVGQEHLEGRLEELKDQDMVGESPLTVDKLVGMPLL